MSPRCGVQGPNPRHGGAGFWGVRAKSKSKPTPKPRASGATIPWAERRERGQHAPQVSLGPEDYAILERVREPGESDPAVLRRGLRELGAKGSKSNASAKSTEQPK
jgi:hypothetical protein